MSILSNRLFTEMTRLDGCQFLGFLSTSFGGQQAEIGNRILTVPVPSLVKVGDVVNGPGGTKILLMEHSDDNDQEVNFRAAYVNAAYTWKRNIKVMDPVARVMKDFKAQNLGVVYAYLDKPTDTSVGTMHDTRYSFYTGSDVQEGDLVGDRIVKKVMISLGVKFVYVE